ncbi:MAG TPA: hypothetical protein VFU22_28960 [Roseiflexaceae bacterium]|nr:hypothetical protein [Roseiflexaceae bacterium]
MNQREIVLASAGYGAIGALFGILTHIGDDLTVALAEGLDIDYQPYRSSVEAVRDVITMVPGTPDWADARRHFIALVNCYRDLLELMPPNNMPTLRAAAAELCEAQTIAQDAVARLGQRLGLLDGVRR